MNDQDKISMAIFAGCIIVIFIGAFLFIFNVNIGENTCETLEKHYDKVISEARLNDKENVINSANNFMERAGCEKRWVNE